MKLYEEFKLYETMWEDVATANEATTDSKAVGYDEDVLNACLARVNQGAKEAPSIDDISFIPVALQKDDLKKALKLGNSGELVKGVHGTIIPAQIVDQAYIVVDFLTDDADPTEDDYDAEDDEYYPEEVHTMLVSLQLFGNGVYDPHEHVDGLPIVGESANYSRKLDSKDPYADFDNAVENEIIPNADAIAHEIIQQAWAESGYNDFIGITELPQKPAIKHITLHTNEYSM